MADPEVRTTRRRTLVAIVGAGAGIIAGLGTAAAAGDRGQTGPASTVALVMVVLFGTGLVLAVALGAAHQRERAAATWGLVPLGAWLPGAELVDLPVAWWVVLVPVASGAAYLLGRFLAGPDPVRPASGRPPADAVRVPVSSGERLVWARSLTSRPALLLAAFVAAAAAVQFWSAAYGTPQIAVAGVFMTAAACWALLTSYARVRVGADGVRVEQPLLRRDLATAPIGEVRQARAVQLDPYRLRWNEYGVLRSRGVSGFRATRRGRALALDLTGDREFLVTVPDADTAAGLINAELDRQRSGEGDPRC